MDSSSVGRPQAATARFKLDRSKVNYATARAGVAHPRSSTQRAGMQYGNRAVPSRRAGIPERPSTSLGFISPCPTHSTVARTAGLGVRPNSAGVSCRIAVRRSIEGRGTSDGLPPGWWHKQRTFHTELNAAISGTSVKALEAVLAKAEVLHITDSFEVQRARERLGALKDVDRRLVGAAAGCSVEAVDRAIESAKAIGADESWPSFNDATDRAVVLQELQKELYDAMHHDDIINLAQTVAKAEALQSTQTIEYRDAKLKLDVLGDLRKAKINSNIMKMADFNGSRESKYF